MGEEPQAGPSHSQAVQEARLDDQHAGDDVEADLGRLHIRPRPDSYQDWREVQVTVIPHRLRADELRFRDANHRTIWSIRSQWRKARRNVHIHSPGCCAFQVLLLQGSPRKRTSGLSGGGRCYRREHRVANRNRTEPTASHSITRPTVTCPALRTRNTALWKDPSSSTPLEGDTRQSMSQSQSGR